MKKHKLLWIIFILITIISCTTQKAIPKIEIDKNDPRIEILAGTWYNIPQPNELRPTKFSKSPQVTSDIIYTFKKNGTFTLQNKVKSSKTEKLLWFIVDNKLYLETSTTEIGKSSVFEIKELTNNEMEISFKGYKNIYEPFLCGDGFLYTRTEVPATFGTADKDLQNYFISNLNLSENNLPDAQLFVQLEINCKGEISNIGVELSTNPVFTSKITSLLKNMPKWTPAEQRGKPVNMKKTFRVIYSNNKLNVIGG